MERRGSGLDVERGERSSSRERREKKEKKDTKEKKEKKDKGSRHSTPNALASPNERERKERRGSRREREAAGAAEVRPPPTVVGEFSSSQDRIRIQRPQNTPAKDLWALPSSVRLSSLSLASPNDRFVPYLPARIFSLDRMTCYGKWSAS